jgi:hypothetical protein
MKSLWFTVAMMMAAVPAVAQVDVSGPVTVLFSSPASSATDSRPCTFFQINAALPWYGIALSDPGYESELILLRDSLESQIPLTFTTYSGAVNCGAAIAYDLYLGMQH